MFAILARAGKSAETWSRMARQMTSPLGVFTFMPSKKRPDDHGDLVYMLGGGAAGMISTSVMVQQVITLPFT